MSGTDTDTPSALTVRLHDEAAAVLTVGDEELTPALVDRVRTAAEKAEGADRGVVLLLLGGAGAAEGASPAGTGIHLVNTWERALRRLETSGRPTLALVEGTCTGPALETLLTADYRIAADDARLRLSGAEDGAWPGTAVHRLAQQIGTARARRLLLRRPWLDGEQAADLDLVDETADGGEAALRRAVLVAGELSAVPGREWSIRRRLLFDATLSYEEALGAHLAACDRSLRRRTTAGQTAAGQTAAEEAAADGSLARAR
ncbi:enoyl-CoA-hydratase DpgB [Streptomyces sp. NPDC058155]|uniref:enoyl-CoA-hydratase DpgB n=1 Tax=Streptomyces sp. NPDC058155 TaxID=3346359 RepID=UPI0036E087D1